MAGYDNELSRIVEELNRAAPGSRAQERRAPQLVPVSASLDQLLSYAAKHNASDVLLVTGSAVAMRVNGALTPATGPILSSEDISHLIVPLLDAVQFEELQRARSVDFCFVRESIGRFRANVHHQRGTLAASIRLLPARIPTLESLHLPPGLSRLAERRQGLVLVTGPTGCGKTSTLAALIDLINNKRRDHIVTIEDPIEYQHPNRNSIVEQIEVGHDTPAFVNSLRSILRQTPDVILVGEMRDPETMATALTAAETGHLVLSTLHTNDASQAVSRILDSFPTGHQPQIRQQLSLALLAVVAQQLVPASDGVGRYPALEVMMASDAVRNLIRRGEDHQLRSQISIGRADGMITMEQSLAELVRTGRILKETAFAHCFRVDDLRRHIEG
ncbi:MAG: PilT/PilU family type 4a pilus ATPase [Bryobacteraceae bacterium]